MRRALLALMLLAAPGCKGAGNAAANAAIGTAIGLSFSALSRAQGGCYAACVTGTTCNGETGLCEPLPCRGLCADDERCDDLTQACVKASVPPRIIVGREQRPAETRDYWDAAR